MLALACLRATKSSSSSGVAAYFCCAFQVFCLPLHPFVPPLPIASCSHLLCMYIGYVCEYSWLVGCKVGSHAGKHSLHANRMQLNISGHVLPFKLSLSTKSATVSGAQWCGRQNWTVERTQCGCRSDDTHHLGSTQLRSMYVYVHTCVLP